MMIQYCQYNLICIVRIGIWKSYITAFFVYKREPQITYWHTIYLLGKSEKTWNIYISCRRLVCKSLIDDLKLKGQ